MTCSIIMSINESVHIFTHTFKPITRRVCLLLTSMFIWLVSLVWFLSKLIWTYINIQNTMYIILDCEFLNSFLENFPNHPWILSTCQFQWLVVIIRYKKKHIWLYNRHKSRELRLNMIIRTENITVYTCICYRLCRGTTTVHIKWLSWIFYFHIIHIFIVILWLF